MLAGSRQPTALFVTDIHVYINEIVFSQQHYSMDTFRVLSTRLSEMNGNVNVMHLSRSYVALVMANTA